jgi:hypothetical protein
VTHIDDAARFTAAEAHIIRLLDQAEAMIEGAATPAHRETRARLVLGEVTGWLDSALVRGESTAEVWAMVGAVALGRLVEQQAAAASAPITVDDFSPWGDEAA